VVITGIGRTLGMANRSDAIDAVMETMGKPHSRGRENGGNRGELAKSYSSLCVASSSGWWWHEVLCEPQV